MLVTITIWLHWSEKQGLWEEHAEQTKSIDAEQNWVH